MGRKDKQVKDPVCGMQVSPDAHAIEYQHIPFAFFFPAMQRPLPGQPHLY